MINYYKGGIKKSVGNDEISIDDLATLIKNNPNAEKIKTLHCEVYKSKNYLSIKEKLPCVKPHGVFDIVPVEEKGKTINKAVTKQLSGYLYFDIDKDAIKADIEVYKEFVISNHEDKICMLGKSVGGRGIFFLVKAIGITSDNFNEVHTYFRHIVFKDLPTDESATDIARNFIIPLDEKLYTNKYVEVDVSNHEIKKSSYTANGDNEGIKQYKKREERECYILSDTLLPFIPIDILLKKLKFKTEVNVGNADFIVKPIEYVQMFIPKIIKDTKKHKTFRSIVIHLMHLNPTINLHEIQSYINFINDHFTNGVPMIRKEMLRTVEAEYNRVIETDEINVKTRIKNVHTNPLLSKDEKIIAANRENGKIRKALSLEIIKVAIEALSAQSIETSPARISKITKDKISIATIKRYYKLVVKQMRKQNEKVTAAEPIIKEVYKHPQDHFKRTVATVIHLNNQKKLDKELISGSLRNISGGTNFY